MGVVGGLLLLLLRLVLTMAVAQVLEQAHSQEAEEDDDEEDVLKNPRDLAVLKHCLAKFTRQLKAGKLVREPATYADVM